MSWRGPELPTADDYLRDSSKAKLGAAAVVGALGLVGSLLTGRAWTLGIAIGALLYGLATALGWGLQVIIERWLASSGGLQVGAYVVKIVMLTVGAVVLGAVAPSLLTPALLTFAACVVIGLALDIYIFASRPLPALDVPEHEERDTDVVG